ncbi:uncharacterized protein IWZ02DRAFT_443043 [Phyllosticta citriasiana]|uniref:uncharacterized protein n=1 Tax=Phyllosticta citriasiana TaxID=595635 RepID=UPI0030FDDAE6
MSIHKILCERANSTDLQWTNANDTSPKNNSWSIEAKLALVAVCLAGIIPLVGFICRKQLWPLVLSSFGRHSQISKQVPSSSVSLQPQNLEGHDSRLRRRYHRRLRRRVRRNVLPCFELDSELEDFRSNSLLPRTRGSWHSVTTIINTAHYAEPEP